MAAHGLVARSGADSSRYRAIPCVRTLETGCTPLKGSIDPADRTSFIALDTALDGIGEERSPASEEFRPVIQYCIHRRSEFSGTLLDTGVNLSRDGIDLSVKSPSSQTDVVANRFVKLPLQKSFDIPSGLLAGRVLQALLRIVSHRARSFPPALSDNSLDRKSVV